MKLRTLAAISLLVLAPGGAFAHRTWFLPSSTVLSGDEVWVTFDAAAANEVFYFDHRPLSLDDLVITGPDGAAVEAQNLSEGRLRNTFDLKLDKQGTYRISLVSDGVFGFYKVDGEQKRWRGAASEISTAIPENATDVRIDESVRRVDSFVTLGAPTEDVVEPAGKGLEVEYGTHPNDLFAGEATPMRLLMNGKPAAGVEVSVVPGGIRYRDQLNEMKIVTDKNGGFEVEWPSAGMYWLNVTVEDDKSELPKVTGRRFAYTATLEVMPQ
ncbi:MAG: DUF4198 domain-containing protein [Oricola sp.]|jgi:hypothetical protein|nr:DUF4198 domain-containing protein [Oricola sp.]